MPIEADAAPTRAAAMARRVGPLDVRVDAKAAMIGAFLEANRNNEVTRVAFANTHLLYCALREPGLLDVLRDFHLLNDGVGMHLLSRIAAGKGFDENHNGTDFVPELLDAAPDAGRVFLVGGRDSVVQKAAARLAARHPRLIVCGFQHGYFDAGVEDAVIERIREAKADIILVALGNPLQEHWIHRCSARLGRGLFLAVGALFDFIAQTTPRAPLLLRQARLEWMFRLALEPRRLLRRYTVEIAVVTWAVMKQRWLP